MKEEVLHAAAFIDVVHADERAHYEREHGFPIIEKNAAGKVVKAAPASVYYPLTYRASKHEKFAAQALGFNLAADPERAPYLKRAAEDGKATATPVITLLIGGQGINVFRAVYRDGAPTATAAERRRALIGWAGGSFLLSDLAAAAVTSLPGDVTTQLDVANQTVIGPEGTLEDAAAARFQIADHTWLLVVRDPQPARRQPADPLRRRGAGAGGGARLADLGLEPRGADAGAAARGRRRLAQRAADQAALRGGGAGGDGALEPRRDHRRAADARPRPLQERQRLLRAPGRRRADPGGRGGAAQADPRGRHPRTAGRRRVRDRAAELPARRGQRGRRGDRRGDPRAPSPTTARSSRSPAASASPTSASTRR